MLIKYYQCSQIKKYDIDKGYMHSKDVVQYSLVSLSSLILLLNVW
jgi:hypothetical protein